MSRALALLLLLGAACFSAMAAGPAPEVPAAAAPAKPAEPVQAVVPGPVTAPDSKEVELKNKKSGGLDPGVLIQDTCCAVLTVNGQTLNLFDPKTLPTAKPRVLSIPPVADNAPNNDNSNCLNMKPTSGTRTSITWNSQYWDGNQLLLITLKLDNTGKLTLNYIVNSVNHHAKLDLHKAQIELTCLNDFPGSSVAPLRPPVVGFLPDPKKSNFPHDIKATYSRTASKLILDIHPIKTEHHCSLHKAVWQAAVCQKSDGPCCANGRYLPGQKSKVCRKSNNPCVEDSYCDGINAKCPDGGFVDEGKPCGWNARQGELYSAAIQHTRTPASSYAAVAVASTSAKPTSYEDLEVCAGKCNGQGSCRLGNPITGCCKEQNYAYYGEEYYKSEDDYYGKDSYGKDDYDKYGKDDYGKYGKDGYKGKDDYDKYGKDDYGKYGKDGYKGKDDYDKYGKDGYKGKDGYDRYGKDSYGKDDYGKGDDYDKYGKKDSYVATASDYGNDTPMISCFTA